MYRVTITHVGDASETLPGLTYPVLIQTLAERCYSGDYPEVSHVLVTREDGKSGPKTASFVHAAYEEWRASQKKEQPHA
jgi:hypothetical protein